MDNNEKILNKYRRIEFEERKSELIVEISDRSGYQDEFDVTVLVKDTGLELMEIIVPTLKRAHQEIERVKKLPDFKGRIIEIIENGDVYD